MLRSRPDNLSATHPIPIDLIPSHRIWIDARVQSGEFASAEDAVRLVLDDRINARAAIERDDMAWAKPEVDRALDQLARGMTGPLDRHEAEMDALIAAMRGR